MKKGKDARDCVWPDSQPEESVFEIMMVN